MHMLHPRLAIALAHMHQCVLERHRHADHIPDIRGPDAHVLLQERLGDRVVGGGFDGGVRGGVQWT